MKKKVLSIILIFAMALSFVPSFRIGASAEAPTPTTVTYQGYDDGSKEFIEVTLSGEGEQSFTTISEGNSTSRVKWAAGTYVIGADYDEDGDIDAYDATLAKNDGLLRNFKFSKGIDCTGDVNIIVVYGFTLTATAANKSAKAGISIAEGCKLKIYSQADGNGTISATGKADDNDATKATKSGAGIGGNAGEACGEVDIYGGKITAKCGKNAAGIGGGYVSSNIKSCTVKIYGGVVTATGGENAAAIGGAYQESCLVSLCGGVIYTNGGEDSVSIGDGKNASAIGVVNATDMYAKVSDTEGSFTQTGVKATKDVLTKRYAVLAPKFSILLDGTDL